MSLSIAPRVPRRPTQVRTGKVVSDKMAKTVVVEVHTFRRHPLYGQVQRESKRFLVHDEAETAHIGDEVRFCLCRPISRHKSWILMEISKRSRSQMHLAEETTADYRAADDQAAAGEDTE